MDGPGSTHRTCCIHKAKGVNCRFISTETAATVWKVQQPFVLHLCQWILHRRQLPHSKEGVPTQEHCTVVLSSENWNCLLMSGIRQKRSLFPQGHQTLTSRNRIPYKNRYTQKTRSSHCRAFKAIEMFPQWWGSGRQQKNEVQVWFPKLYMFMKLESQLLNFQVLNNHLATHKEHVRRILLQTSGACFQSHTLSCRYAAYFLKLTLALSPSSLLLVIAMCSL